MSDTVSTPNAPLSAVGVVLAGGQSRRLGRDKALLRTATPTGDVTLIERTVATVRAAGVREVVLSASTQARADSLRDAVPSLAGLHVVLDEQPGSGPLGGLVAALRAFPRHGILLVACDMPRLTTSGLRLTLEAAPEADIVAPRDAGRDQPLHARYGPACLPVAARLLQEGRRAMRGLLTAPDLRVRILDEDDLAARGVCADAFVNVNTPADLAALTNADG